jgi:uncharacterized protein YecE (DUF72 family)
LGQILIGTSSWTDPTLIKSGRFYPSWANSAETRLRYYASQFELVEVDSSYYAIPDSKTAGLWVNRTPDNFVFDIKAFRLFTLHPTPLKSLARDIKESLPAELREKSNLYHRDLPSSVTDELWKRFERALLPLDSSGKLGVVMFQFPPWFYPGNEQHEYILSCKEKLPQYRVAVEFRHNSWVNDKNRERTLDFLRDNDLPFVCVDAPQGFKSSMPPLSEATSDIGAIRFHGRNREVWEKKGVSVSERFDYLYSQEELREWVPRVASLGQNTRQLHVLFNNCYQDKAVTNARQLAVMMD